MQSLGALGLDTPGLAACGDESSCAADGDRTGSTSCSADVPLDPLTGEILRKESRPALGPRGSGTQT
jgi:hypothetical protein